MLGAMRLWVGLACMVAASLQAADVGQAPLIFREDWTATPPAIPLSQRDVANENLEISIRGQGPPLVKKSFHDARDWDPHYVWSGLAQGPWAVTLALADGGLMDLTGTATVRWRTRQSGFRALRVVLGLDGGRWLVSEAADGESTHWRISEIALSGTRWRQLDIESVTESSWVDAPDLSRVRWVGFTDLMRGGRSRACSRLDWIEVYGQRVPTGPLQVFILSGQSNMVGWGNSLELESVARFGHDNRLFMFEDGSWKQLKPHRDPSRQQRETWGIREFTFGPEIGFAHALAEAWPGKRIGIVKQAVGGTGIMAWAPEWNERDADITGDARKGPLYEELVGKALAAREAGDVEFRGFLWLQGAKDMRASATAARYAENLDQLISALRSRLGTPELPVLIGSYRQDNIPDSLEGIDPSDFGTDARRPGAWQVLLAQSTVSKRIARSATVILRDLPRHPRNIHANTEGMLQAGRAYANIFLERFAGTE